MSFTNYTQLPTDDIMMMVMMSDECLILPYHRVECPLFPWSAVPVSSIYYIAICRNVEEGIPQALSHFICLYTNLPWLASKYKNLWIKARAAVHSGSGGGGRSSTKARNCRTCLEILIAFIWLELRTLFTEYSAQKTWNTAIVNHSVVNTRQHWFWWIAMDAKKDRRLSKDWICLPSLF